MWLDYRVADLRMGRRCAFGERGDTRWDEILASTFRSRIKEHGCLDFDEVCVMCQTSFANKHGNQVPNPLRLIRIIFDT